MSPGIKHQEEEYNVDSHEIKEASNEESFLSMEMRKRKLFKIFEKIVEK